MQLEDILANVADQDKGAWFELADPVSGAATGIKLKIAGPDSATQHRAHLALTDEMAEMADADGRISAENRERASLNLLARCVLDWEITEEGEPVPFDTKNLLRILRIPWVRAQVDLFAGDRRAHRGGA